MSGSQRTCSCPLCGSHWWCDTRALHPRSQTALLAPQQPAVGSDLHVQVQLDDHEPLVSAPLLHHILLGSLQGNLQLSRLDARVLNGPTLLSISDDSLQGCPLAFMSLDLCLKVPDVAVQLRALCLHAGKVIPVLPNEHLQLLVLDLSASAWLQWAISSYWARTSGLMPSTSRE